MKTASLATENSVCRRLFARVDIASLVAFRILFGAMMLWWVLRYTLSGNIEPRFVNYQFHFTYYGFGWIKPWPGFGMRLHFLVLGAAAACLLLGLAYRVAAVLFFLGFTYLFLLEQTYFNNHYYLICLISLMMVFVPANRACSVDVLLNPKLRSDTVPSWSLWLLRAQIGIPYFFGGIMKIDHDWLRGATMRAFLKNEKFAPLLGSFFREEWAIETFSYVGLCFDLLVVPMLLWKKTRAIAFGFALVFHLSNVVLFNLGTKDLDIGIFPWFMIAATTVFFAPNWPRRLLKLPPLPGSDKSTALSTHPLSKQQKWTVALLSLYLFVQVIVPFQHLLYPGNANWTEEGQTFSWRMMLRVKEVTSVSLEVVDRKTGETLGVDPTRFLTPRQLREMPGKPHLVHQLALHIDRAMREQGRENFEVRARVMASLNGRKPQLLIDPEANLAASPYSLRSAPWIMPLKEPLPQ